MFLIVFSVRIGFSVFKDAINNRISLVTVKVVQSSISICNFVQATSSNTQHLRIKSFFFNFYILSIFKKLV